MSPPPASEYDFDDVGEDSPFLGGDAEPADADAVLVPARDDAPRRLPGKWYQTKSPGAVVAMLSAILFLLVLSATLAMMPLVRLMEDGICRRYYGTTEPVDEEKCKVGDIQSQLAWLGGIAGVVDAVVGLTVSFPWGIMSDIVGRKPIFRLAYLGVILQFVWASIVVYFSAVLPIQLVLLGPGMAIIGGGLNVAIAVMHAIIADVTDERASAFIWMSLGAIAGSVVGPAAAAKLMESVSPWIPILIPLFILTPMVYAITIFMPETLPRGSKDGVDGSGRSSSPFAQKPLGAALRAHLRHTWARLRESLAALRSRSVLLLLAVFLLQNPVQAAQNQILAQTVSTRFGWTLARVGYLVSLRGIVTVAVLVLLPAASALLTAPRAGPKAITVPMGGGRHLRLPGAGMSVFRKDLTLAQASLVALAVGSLLCAGASVGALVAGIVVSTLAVGLGSAAKSLVAYYVAPEHTTRLYTLTGMVETLGGLFAGPTLAWAFQTGVRLKGAWMGLPFYYLTVLVLLALAAVCFVRPPLAEKAADEEDARSARED